MVLIGSTPYLAKEVYRIPLRFCEDHANSIDQGCGENCGQLNHREIKTLFVALRDTFHDQDEFEMKRQGNSKVFIYARVSKSIYNAAEDIEEEYVL